AGLQRCILTLCRFWEAAERASAAGCLTHVVHVERGELGAAAGVAEESDPTVGAGRAALTGAGAARQIRAAPDDRLRVPAGGASDVAAFGDARREAIGHFAVADLLAAVG